MNISELLLDVISEFCENDNQARRFGTDTELYHSEIHMLQCIAENPDLHISGIARILGVTRGAASQTAKRLERKEMIIKESSPESIKMVVLSLTAKGEVAVLNHKVAHERYSKVIKNLLAQADSGQIEFLTKFLKDFEKEIKKEH